MSEDKFLNKYRIPSARAPWHGYDGGIYFVTICTAEREFFFGKIFDGQMILSPIGQYADEQFANVTNHYPYAQIPLFVIMPNHIHAIVMVNGDEWKLHQSGKSDGNGTDGVHDGNDRGGVHDGNDSRGGVHTASTGKRWKSQAVDKTMQIISHQKGPLSVVIGGLKRAVTKYANEHQIMFGWQTRFYDRIVRNQDELNRIALYIEQNVANWDENEWHS